MFLYDIYKYMKKNKNTTETNTNQPETRRGLSSSLCEEKNEDRMFNGF